MLSTDTTYTTLVSALKILLIVVTCYLCYVTRNQWCLLVGFHPIDRVTSKYMRNFHRVMSNWYDSLLEIPASCFDTLWWEHKFFLLLGGKKGENEIHVLLLSFPLKEKKFIFLRLSLSRLWYCNIHWDLLTPLDPINLSWLWRRFLTSVCPQLGTYN